MARANHTHILFILDRSGSMQTLHADVVGGFNQFLSSQQAAEGTADRPERVVVAVMTDGEENASLEYTFERIQTMIEHQRSFYNWEFVFLASELRTLDLSLDMGVKREKSRRWVKSSAGTMAAFSIMDLEIRKVRRGEG